MAPIDIVVPQPPTFPRPPETPPSSPHLRTCEQVHTLNTGQFQELLKAIKAIQAIQTPPAPGDANQPTDIKDSSNDKQQAPARASKLEFKTVNEIWDAKAYEYKIAEPSKELSELDQYVFVVRQRIDKITMDLTCYIDIKSEELRDILRTVLRDVQIINLNEDKPTVEQNLLYNYIRELESYQSNTDASTTRNTTCSKHLDLLIGFIKTSYKSTAQRFLSLLQNDEITYDLLWALFKPNSVVYTTCFGTDKPRCVLFDGGEEKATNFGVKYYNMECRYLDYNGQVFGEASVDLAIFKFRGRKRISTLKAFPLQYHPDEEGIKAQLTQCGRKFVSMLGAHHRHCQGTAFYMKEGEPVKIFVDSRVMLDAAFFRKMNPNYARPQPQELVKKRTEDDGYLEMYSESSKKRALDQIKDNGIEPTQIEENKLLICCPTLPGFGLGDKLWMEFAVADIQDIKWSSSPFECLTIPQEEKEVIIALAQTRLGLMPSVPFDDFVAGKGRGLNVLLHGTPGVGKTLTAEAVSEHLQRPLYSISAGELSLDSAVMEVQLSRVFQTANHWNALILLDEADVYLEQRSMHDVARNKLVSVFLRKIEYCEGIMFLTTNRVSNFDEAILSRIHLMLKYNELRIEARNQIWGHFLQRAPTSNGAAVVACKEIDRLAKTKLNGRQIKNVVAIAHALATKKNTQVAYSHVLQAVKASENFFREFNGTDVMESLFI